MALIRAGFIPIPPGRAPGFDHADTYHDSDGGSRVYVAHTGADRVDVIDCAAAAWIRALPGHPGVAGVLVSRDADLLCTSDRAVARVSVYRCSDEALLGQVDVGPHPNGLAFDPVHQRLFSFNLGEPVGENCTASVIDLAKQRVVATIGLPGRPRRLYCAADGKALVVLDRDTGAAGESLALPGAPDVVMHDDALGHLYVAIGDPGVICVADTRTMRVVQTVPTEPGAHTLGIDPRRHVVYAFLPASGGAAVFEGK